MFHIVFNKIHDNDVDIKIDKITDKKKETQ